MAEHITIGGLHHLTAVTGNVSGNLRFYRQVLGLRLVKRTVNQDDVSAYHLFYGDTQGSPGTEVTFFDWPHAGPNRPGAGEVATVSLRVNGHETLEWWAQRFAEQGVAHNGLQQRAGVSFLPFTDPEGQRLELVDDGGAAGVPGGTPWDESAVPAQYAVRGLSSVTLHVRDLSPTEQVLTDVLGFRRADDQEGVCVLESGPGGPGTQVRIARPAEQAPARTGIGGVHHVAFRAANDVEHEQWQQRISAAGLAVTPVIDRFYFRSIYFREPGGVLFEIATDGPGFATDEDPAHLGEHLALPPFLEPHRAKIEAGLRPIE